jgi:hypothetical protein
MRICLSANNVEAASIISPLVAVDVGAAVATALLVMEPSPPPVLEGLRMEE